MNKKFHLIVTITLLIVAVISCIIGDYWSAFCNVLWAFVAFLIGKSEGVYSDTIPEEEPASVAQSTVVFYGLTGSVGNTEEESVSEDLEEAIDKSLICHDNRGDDFRSDKQIETAYRYGFESGANWRFERVKEALLSEVLPCFMNGGEADEIVAKLEEVLNKK